LLNDEQLASLEPSNHLAGEGQNGDKQKQTAVRDMWNDDGDDFFGHTAGVSMDRQDENPALAPSQSTRGKGRKAGTSTRGRKPGAKKKAGTNAGVVFKEHGGL